MNDDDKLPDQAEQRFAVNLRAARDRAGLSQEAVATQMREQGFAHVRQQTIAQIEGGSRSVRLGEALAFSRITKTSIDALVRPRGLAQNAWRLLDDSRKIREAHQALTTWANRLNTARERLRRTLAQAEQAGLAEAVADEMYIARRAVALDAMTAAQLLVDEWLYGAAARPGRTLDDKERAAAKAVASALNELADDTGPPESRQEAAAREVHQQVRAAEDVLIHMKERAADAGRKDA